MKLFRLCLSSITVVTLWNSILYSIGEIVVSRVCIARNEHELSVNYCA